MKKSPLLIIAILLPFLSKAQKLLGATESTIADSMKNKDVFAPGIKPDGKDGLILTYLDYMHKDGTPRYDDNFLLISNQYLLKNGKCVMIVDVYKNVYLNDFTKSFHADPQKYKKVNETEWTDEKDNLQIKITPEPPYFMVQYQPIK